MIKISNWLCENKEWVFSGIGITVLTVGYTLIKKLFLRREKNSSRTVIKQTNKGTKNTQIGIQNNYGTEEKSSD